MAKGTESQKLIANNKKAYHDYFVEETWEAGLALAAHGLTPLRWYCHFAVSATPDNLSRHTPPPDKCGAFFVFPSSPLQKHPPDQNRCHQIGDQNSIAHIVLLSINERLHLCPPLAAAVASGFHRHGKVICTPKRSDKQRH